MTLRAIVVLTALCAVLAGAGRRGWKGALAVLLVAGTGLVALELPPARAGVAEGIACAILVPLFPLHGLYRRALTRLPAHLAAVVAVVLPVVGFHELASFAQGFPPLMARILAALAIAGMVLSASRAFVKPEPAAAVADASLAFYAISWWFLSTGRAPWASTMTFTLAVGLATCGLLLVQSPLQGRTGALLEQAPADLAPQTPRRAVMLWLLVVAALGLPPFGVYSGLVGMLLGPHFTWSAAVFAVAFAWLGASWLLFDLGQDGLFGSGRARRPCDLAPLELLSLGVILVLLLALGIAPSGFLTP